MADKVLNIKLNYKGKNLDVAKYKRDFDKNFYIGSNKDLFWQILDPTFPDKFLLLECDKDKYTLNLRQGMEAKVRKGDQILDSARLKQEQLMNGNQLFLTPETSGSVVFSQNWEITYEFLVPFKQVLSPEQQKLVLQYSHRAEPTTEDKFSRNMMIIGIVFTILSMVIFSLTYKPVHLENTLQNRLDASKRMAQYVTAEVREIPNKSNEADDAGDKAAAEAAAKAAAEAAANRGKQTKSNDVVGAGSIESQFGFDPGATQAGTRSAKVIQVTTERDLVAEGIGGGGGGKGQGGGTRGSGGGSRGASAFNVTPSGKRTQNMGELFQGNINVTGARGYKEIDAKALGGKTGKIEAQRIVSSSQIGAVRSRFVSAGIVPVKETQISTSSPEVKAELGNVRNYVSTYKPQIQSLFVTESQIRDMYGALEFTLYINAGGTVAGVDIKSKPGSFFTDSFLQKAKSVIEKWKVPVNKQVIYTFSWQFIKN